MSWRKGRRNQREGSGQVHGLQQLDWFSKMVVSSFDEARGGGRGKVTLYAFVVGWIVPPSFVAKQIEQTTKERMASTNSLPLMLWNNHSELYLSTASQVVSIWGPFLGREKSKARPVSSDNTTKGKAEVTGLIIHSWHCSLLKVQYSLNEVKVYCYMPINVNYYSYDFATFYCLGCYLNWHIKA